MNRSTFYTLNSFLLLFCLLASQAQATLTGARANSIKTQLFASSQNNVTLNWQIATSPGHTQGVSSTAPAEIFDPATGNALASIGGSLSQSGAGPFTLSETLPFSARQVQNWLDTGIQRVVLRRTFQELVPRGSSVIGDIVFNLSTNPLSLNRDGARELNIQSLQLSLHENQQVALHESGSTNQSAIKIVELNSALQPQLTLYYAGTGLLEGKWQIAEPDSSQGLALFRTLSIVRQSLVKSQQSQISGPVLPTNRAGKYLLRFCVTDTAESDSISVTSTDCANPALSVQTVYQVMPNSAPIELLQIHSPQQETVNATSPFSWSVAQGAVIYKLDVFEFVITEFDKNRAQLVTGILLPGSHTQTALSELMQSKLQEGVRYAWQVSAINESGRVLAQSKRYSFLYQP